MEKEKKRKKKISLLIWEHTSVIKRRDDEHFIREGLLWNKKGDPVETWVSDFWGDWLLPFFQFVEVFKEREFLN